MSNPLYPPHPASLLSADHRGRHATLSPAGHDPLARTPSPSTGRSLTSRSRSPALRISTDVGPSSSTNTPQQATRPSKTSLDGGHSSDGSTGSSRPSGNLHPTTAQTPSIKTALVQNWSSAASNASSAAPSPVISAMGDMTPLPSPLMSADSPGPWKRLVAGTPPRPRARLGSVGEDSVLRTTPEGPGSSSSAALNVPKRKVYPALDPLGAQSPSLAVREHLQNQNLDAPRDRSVSEYVPEPLGIPKRQATVSGAHGKQTDAGAAPATASQVSPQMRREANLAEARGLTPAAGHNPPTPPPSESASTTATATSSTAAAAGELFEARGRHDGKKRRWRALRCLGQGTFSQVMQATSQVDAHPGDAAPRKSLVAVKICEHGPRGGANEDRIEMSLKRELDILRSIHHPSLVDLKAWSVEASRAILVLSYSPGGDLFDAATGLRHLLTPGLLRRVFAEIVGAVRYLHGQMIVHRDIKLENVLVNLTPAELADPSMDWTRYPNSITTLADLGLSRRIASPDEKLETRCGSDDYAAPEVIMGQPYDGRATDAWSLGVLLYALLESRLPFDPHPGMSDAHRMRSRTSHRIARVEWRWFEYGRKPDDDSDDEDGEHGADAAKFRDRGLLGAMEAAEGLLKRARSRWPLAKVADLDFVRGGCVPEGGLKFWEEQEGQVVP